MKNFVLPVAILLLFCIAECHRGQSDKTTVHIQFASADTQRVNRLLDESDKLANEGQYAEAKNRINTARQLSDSLHYKNGLQGVYGEKANILLLKYKADSAEVVLKEGIAFSPQGGKVYDLYSMLGTAYKYEGKNEQAVKALNTAASLVDSTKDAAKLARIKLNMALLYYDMGSRAEAFKYYQQGLHTAEQAQDSSFLAVILNNLGDTYNNEKDYEKATYYLQRSLTISKAINFKVNELRSLTNLANTKKDAGEPDEALPYYQKALALSKEVRPNSPPIIIYYNLGTLYGDKGDPAKAEAYFKKSLNYSRQAGIGPGLYHNSMGLGELARQQGHVAEAITWYSRALQNAQKLHSLSFEKAAHEQLYKLYKQSENNSQALAHLESLKTITDSLSQQAYEQKLAEYKTKLEVGRQTQINKALSAKQEKQQALLSMQYWLIVAAILLILLLVVIAVIQYRSKKREQEALRLLHEKSDELERLNQVKNRLFAILSHDLRNPLSAMQGMLYLLRNGDLSKDDIQEMSAQLENSMRHNLNIMENLLVWAQQQLSGINIHAEVLDVHDVAEEIMTDHEFQAGQKNITLVNDVQQSLKVHADHDLLNLILRNLIGNSIKFSGAGGKIAVSGRRGKDMTAISVSDTGIGIPAGQQQVLFNADLRSRPGTQNEKGSGLGLNLCKEFVEAQGGEITFISEENKGTTFTLTLPAAEG